MCFSAVTVFGRRGSSLRDRGEPNVKASRDRR
jgi:hypothetical protein